MHVCTHLRLVGNYEMTEYRFVCLNHSIYKKAKGHPISDTPTGTGNFSRWNSASVCITR